MEEINGGNCTGQSTVAEICNTHECPGNSNMLLMLEDNGIILVVLIPYVYCFTFIHIYYS